MGNSLSTGSGKGEVLSLDIAYDFYDIDDNLEDLILWMGYYHSQCAFYNKLFNKDYGEGSENDDDDDVNKKGQAYRNRVMAHARSLLNPSKKEDTVDTNNLDAATMLASFIRNQRHRYDKLYMSAIDGITVEHTDLAKRFNNCMRSMIKAGIKKNPKIMAQIKLRMYDSIPKIEKDFKFDMINEFLNDEELMSYSQQQMDKAPESVKEKDKMLKELRTDYNDRAFDASNDFLESQDYWFGENHLDLLEAFSDYKAFYAKDHPGRKLLKEVEEKDGKFYMPMPTWGGKTKEDFIRGEEAIDEDEEDEDVDCYAM